MTGEPEPGPTSPSKAPLSTTIAGVPAIAIRLAEKGRDVEVVVEVEIVVANVEDIASALGTAVQDWAGQVPFARGAALRTRGRPWRRQVWGRP